MDKMRSANQKIKLLVLAILLVFSAQTLVANGSQEKSSEPAKKVVVQAPSQPSAGIGSNLIGKVEGPEVVTDPALFPTSFQEAPELKSLVASGKLDPVGKRLGKDPLVLKPVHEIGTYGGTWRRGFTGPGDTLNGLRIATGRDGLLYFKYNATDVVPNLAKGYELSEDGRVTTVFLREGMRWSDGELFTADDIVFWYEHIYLNKELVPYGQTEFKINGKDGIVEKVDTYTVKFIFDEPFYSFPANLAMAGWAEKGMFMKGFYAPEHYLKQFLPEFTSEAQLAKLVAEGSYGNWVNLFKAKSNWCFNVDQPALTPWLTVKTPSESTWELKRNPYSIWVDTAGNQLPYIGTIVMTLAENVEVLNLRAIAGEYDMQARHLRMSNLPVFLENQDKGGYKVSLDPGPGCEFSITVNLTYDADPEITKLLNTTDFRRALSLGINRDQINEAFWLGTGKIWNILPPADNKYYPGGDYGTLWTDFDPAKANQMLDAIGLSKKDSEGFRMRTDGKGRLTIEIAAMTNQLVPYVEACEMVREQWKKIGIDLKVNSVERSFALTQAAANATQLGAWVADGNDDPFLFPANVLPVTSLPSMSQGTLIGLWYDTNGEQGVAPEPKLKEVLDMLRKGPSVKEAERNVLGQEMYKLMADNVWQIGVIAQGSNFLGTRVTNVNMGNVPERIWNSPLFMNPNNARPVTFYYKNK
jgi:peptide/nickel transport system substrate-binding protein